PALRPMICERGESGAVPSNMWQSVGACYTQLCQRKYSSKGEPTRGRGMHVRTNMVAMFDSVILFVSECCTTSARNRISRVSSSLLPIGSIDTTVRILLTCSLTSSVPWKLWLDVVVM